jgi:hypothetical protein
MSAPLRFAAKVVGVLLLAFSATGAPLESGFREETSVVLTGAAGLALIASCSPMEFPTKQWDPESKDIATAEAALAPALRSALRTMNDDSSPADYFRQYAGGFYEGSHIIYTRGFHRSYFDRLPAGSSRLSSWRRNAVPEQRGHTRLWCAYWVKHTKRLIPTSSMGDPAMGVGFRGIRE